ncbi:MAG: GNAT family N-acetyltransferase [Lachnospiraceae bacterium]|nr:GNAT family N-acetyltransferase [Lachnospiraceae bacterium]
MQFAHEMQYKNPTDQQSSIEMTPYSPVFQEKYKTIYNECYHEMRKALGIEPFDFIQDDSFFETGMDCVYLLLQKDEIIGSVAIKDEEIDDLIVNPNYQGQGYGRNILLWALSHIDSKRVILHVADWNKKAIRLYEKNGFVITDTFEI